MEKNDNKRVIPSFDIFHELLLVRESCRNYLDKEVDPVLLEKAVQLACVAPSACNSQPWSFHIVTNSDLVKKIGLACKQATFNHFCLKVPSFIVVVQEKANLLERVADSIGKKDFASIDIGLATSQLVLGLSTLGLSSCIIGAFRKNEIEEALNIKAEIRLVISIGYCEDLPREKKRKSEKQTIYKYE